MASVTLCPICRTSISWYPNANEDMPKHCKKRCKDCGKIHIHWTVRSGTMVCPGDREPSAPGYHTEKPISRRTRHLRRLKKDGSSRKV
jgi:hypothetical protein